MKRVTGVLGIWVPRELRGQLGVDRLRFPAASPTFFATESTSGPETPPEQKNIEKEVKYGVNTPHNVGEFASEAAQAVRGLGRAASATVHVAADAVKRSLSKKSDATANTKIHGSAGMMQQTYDGTSLPPSDDAAPRSYAKTKYQQIADIEKPFFPHGEKSLNELYPEVAEAARLQNIGETSLDINTSPPHASPQKSSDDDQSIMSKNLHEVGP